MTHSLSNPDSKKFVVCHDGQDVYHYTTIESGELKTGQQKMDVFDSEQKAYDKHGENLPARYRVVESRTDGALSIEPIDSNLPIDGAVIDEVALKQTALDRYDELTK